MYFFVSNKKFEDGEVLYPRIPQNRLTRDGREDSKVPRVCVCKSIVGAIKSTEIYTKCKTIYVYTCDPKNVISPTEKQVSDSIYTGEEWSLYPISISLFTILHIKKDIISDDVSRWNFSDKKSIGFYTFSIYGIDYERISNMKHAFY